VSSYRCGHHFIFSIREEGGAAVIVAILHESMDLPALVRERLAEEGLDG
jgi:plasmid stabilization system protein ParE